MFRVLEFGGNWSGPMVGQYLQALRCQVIRVESRDHLDAVRQLPAPRDCGAKIEGATAADNPYFAQLNAGKQSVELDLRTPAGLAAARALAADADVIVENLAPGAIERLGMSYAVLAAANPALCMLSMPTLHPGDPRESLRGYAPVFTGLGGLEAQVRYPDEITGMLMTGWGDPVGGMTGLLGLLAALHRRARTGLGAYVYVSQIKAVTWQLIEPFTVWRGGAKAVEAPTVVLGTTDPSRWVAAALTEDQWRAHSGEPIAEWSAARSAEDVIAALAAFGHPAAVVQRIDTASDSERIRRRGIVTDGGNEVIGGWHRYHVPWRVNGLTPKVQGAAPGLGEHTEQFVGRPAASAEPTINSGRDDAGAI